MLSTISSKPPANHLKAEFPVSDAVVEEDKRESTPEDQEEEEEATAKQLAHDVQPLSEGNSMEKRINALEQSLVSSCLDWMIPQAPGHNYCPKCSSNTNSRFRFPRLWNSFGTTSGTNMSMTRGCLLCSSSKAISIFQLSLMKIQTSRMAANLSSWSLSLRMLQPLKIPILSYLYVFGLIRGQFWPSLPKLRDGHISSSLPSSDGHTEAFYL